MTGSTAKGRDRAQSRWLAVTPGEPAGIGPEIVARVAAEQPDWPLLVVADPDLMTRALQTVSSRLRVVEWSGAETRETGTLPCLPVALPGREIAGQPQPSQANYVLQCLRAAVDSISRGEVAGLVTGPLQKSSINDAGIPFSGHTEFLAGLAGEAPVVMMLAAPQLRVSLVTTHLPLRAVPDAVTRSRVEQTIRITHRELQHRFGIERPRLQVLGLNPHAGEDGHLGSEDAAEIAPAIADCRAEGIEAVGPVPADTAFTPPRLARCDAVVAMYHDQGLAVLKHAGFGQSVNVTLGLPFVRTSVDHGTALDIAGQGIADTSSLRQAISLAMQLADSGA